MSPPEILCLFHTDATALTFLKSAEGSKLVGDLIIEVSPQPTLAFLLGLETPANHPGIAGTLGSIGLAELAVEHDDSPAPIVLASGSPTSTSAVSAALSQLKSTGSNYRRITLLVRLREAANIGAALGNADRFAVAWDVTALPSSDLIESANWVRDEGFTDPDCFEGIFSYTPSLLDGTAVTHVQKLSAMIAPLREANPTIHSEIVIAST